MGHLQYGNNSFAMDDRVLLHVQIALYEVARHREAFYVTWIRPRQQGGGRRAIFVTPGVPMMFSYENSDYARINRSWAAHMIENALTGPGLAVVPEDQVPTGRPEDANMKALIPPKASRAHRDALQKLTAS